VGVLHAALAVGHEVWGNEIVQGVEDTLGE